MTPLERARELIALADKATPGPWLISMRASYYHYQVSAENGTRLFGTFDALESDAKPDAREANSEYVAAANPEAVSAICRALIAAEERVQELERDALRFRWLYAHGAQQLAAIAYRDKSACMFSDPLDAIDAAVQKARTP